MPQNLGQYIATQIIKRYNCENVLDAFAGCGGSLIQLSKLIKNTSGVEID